MEAKQLLIYLLNYLVPFIPAPILYALLHPLVATAATGLSAFVIYVARSEYKLSRDKRWENHKAELVVKDREHKAKIVKNLLKDEEIESLEFEGVKVKRRRREPIKLRATG